MAKRALVTGATGQDGSYLADLLLGKGYEVHALIRQTTQFTPDRWGHLRGAMKAGLKVTFGDLGDAARLRSVVEEVRPDEVYNLAAQSHVGESFEQPENTCQVTAMGALRMLEAVRQAAPRARFYQASSSEMFGKVRESPQNELTPFHPRSPYGCAKAFAHDITRNYREAYGLFAVGGILYNHESVRRGQEFVTRKITRAVGRIVAGLDQDVTLGNLDAKRDWGYAPDYVEAMWLMLQRDVPQDLVIGTGTMHSVREFAQMAFEVVGLDHERYVKVDARFNRPSEVDTLCANPTLARSALGWVPKVPFGRMVEIMVEHDVNDARREKNWIDKCFSK